MRTRKAFLANRSVLADSGEVATDINVRDPITAITLEFRATNGATNNQDAPLCRCIESIEVVDGSDVIYSLDGYLALAYNVETQGGFSRQVISESPNVVQTFYVEIPFGMFRGDVSRSLDTARFVNPQIRVKWNLAAVRAVGATGFVSGTLRYTVVADVMEGVTAPQGILVAKEHYSWATVSGGVEYIDLPNQYPIRGMLLRVSDAGNSLSGCVNHLKVNCDVDAYVPIDMMMSDLFTHYLVGRGPYGYKHTLHRANADVLAFVVKEAEVVGLSVDAILNVWAAYENTGVGQGALLLHEVYTTTVTEHRARTVDTEITAGVVGFAPWSTVLIPFGAGRDPNQWLPAPTYRSIRLEVEGGVTGAAGFISLVQDRPY